MTKMATGQLRNQVPLLTIARASKMLGVSDASLRQWTDEGKINAFITPGGHRRYAEAELRDFIGAKRRVHGVKDLVARMELGPSIQSELAHRHFANTLWYSKLDQDSKAHLGELGRRIYRLVITYLTKKKQRDETMRLAREVGREFGEYLAEIGLSLTDALEAFLLHRAPLINAATDLMKRREALNERAAEAIPLVTQITDEALLSLVAAYHDRQNSNSSKGLSQR